MRVRVLIAVMSGAERLVVGGRQHRRVARRVRRGRRRVRRRRALLHLEARAALWPAARLARTRSY